MVNWFSLNEIQQMTKEKVEKNKKVVDKQETM